MHLCKCSTLKREMFMHEEKKTNNYYYQADAMGVLSI